MGDSQQATQGAPLSSGASHHELLGMPKGHPLVEHIGNEQIAESAVLLAMDVMDKYSEVIIQNGKAYRVSIGNEHFVDHAGKIDNAYRDSQKSLGFRLYQEHSGHDADAYNPVYIVANEAIHNAVFALNPSTRSIMHDHRPEDEPETINQIYELVGRIKADAIDKKEEAAQATREKISRVTAEASARRKRRWKAVGKIALTAAVIAAGVTGATVGREQYSDWRTEVDAREAAEAEAKVDAADQTAREFDQAYDIEQIDAVESGQTAISPATEQFNEATVPELGADAMSNEVAFDVTQPRAISVDDITSDDKDCKTVTVRHRPEDSFYVTHNGDPDAAMVFRLDAETDKLELCYYGNMGPGGEVPTEVYIQKDTPPQ